MCLLHAGWGKNRAHTECSNHTSTWLKQLSVALQCALHADGKQQRNASAYRQEAAVTPNLAEAQELLAYHCYVWLHHTMHLQLTPQTYQHDFL